MEKQGLLLAIDGGGTKTEYILCDMDGAIRKRVVRGSSNPIDLGLEAACAELKTGIGEALSGDWQTPVSGLFAGLSGGMSSGRDGLMSFFRELMPGVPLNVWGDTLNAIASGILSGEGCTLIAGTGSSASARYQGKSFRCGGWGYLFDGFGGGYDLGAAAIRHTLASRDLREPRGRMAELLEAQIGETAEQHLRVFYDKGKTYIASFAPIVFRAAEESDPAALAVLDRNAAYMAELLEALFAQVERVFPGQMTCPDVVMTGSLFKQKALWEPRLEKALHRPCHRIYHDAPAVFGSAAEACRLAGGTVTEDFRSRFLRDYRAAQNRV